jgi:hypothetical protein
MVLRKQQGNTDHGDIPLAQQMAAVDNPLALAQPIEIICI